MFNLLFFNLVCIYLWLVHLQCHIDAPLSSWQLQSGSKLISGRKTPLKNMKRRSHSSPRYCISTQTTGNVVKYLTSFWGQSLFITIRLVRVTTNSNRELDKLFKTIKRVYHQLQLCLYEFWFDFGWLNEWGWVGFSHRRINFCSHRLSYY